MRAAVKGVGALVFKVELASEPMMLARRPRSESASGL
jgi:hypothetical protein